MSVQGNFKILLQKKIMNELEMCFHVFINFTHSLNLFHLQHCSDIYLS